MITLLPSWASGETQEAAAWIAAGLVAAAELAQAFLAHPVSAMLLSSAGLIIFLLTLGSLTYGWRGGLGFLACVYPVAFALEALSVAIGFPFGYSTHIGPSAQLLGVPHAVPILYVTAGYLAWSIARLLIVGDSLGLAAPVLAGRLDPHWVGRVSDVRVPRTAGTHHREVLRAAADTVARPLPAQRGGLRIPPGAGHGCGDGRRAHLPHRPRTAPVATPHRGRRVNLRREVSRTPRGRAWVRPEFAAAPAPALMVTPRRW
ncbi:carotenoid biosynthesis protein [Mycolicibacterium sp. S2-37]|nr:carotenoid biosynthesis protein [Mycolicibacterium sp. S2-37]